MKNISSFWAGAVRDVRNDPEGTFLFVTGIILGNVGYLMVKLYVGLY